MAIFLFSFCCLAFTHPFVIVVEQRVARSSSNTRNKRARSSTSQTIINCDLYPDLEQDPIAKVKMVFPFFCNISTFCCLIFHLAINSFSYFKGN